VDREEAEPRMNSTLPTVPLDDERRERLVAAAKASGGMEAPAAIASPAAMASPAMAPMGH
jgi:hypothetical protein